MNLRGASSGRPVVVVPTSRRPGRVIGQLMLLVVLTAAGVFLWRQHDWLLDELYLYHYHPSTAVAQLATDDGMTSQAQRLFYVNHPQLADQGVFNQHCVNPSEQVVVLGCYTGNRQGIYLYTITDSRLDGIEQVTAAHEMLHQAYDRLSKSERSRINDLLLSYYNTNATADLKTQMASYQQTEPGEELNELHSILGTEVANLPPALETYYAQYFSSRTKIATYYNQYHSEFTQRQQQVATYDAQLSTMKQQIDTKRADLSSKETTLTSLRNQLNSDLSTNQISAYNAAVPGYNALVTQYKQELQDTNNLIDQYNAVLDKRNAIAVQEQQLEQAIDSQVTSANKQ